MTRHTYVFVLMIIILGVAVSFCKQKITDTCSSDKDCGEGNFCKKDEGYCFCKDDRGCGEGKFCNALSFCQKFLGCRTNEDCEPSTFCDPISRKCMDNSLCTVHAHCEFNKICKQNSCIEACETSGDCYPGFVCINKKCSKNACFQNSDCGYGEYCDNNECIKDTRGPFCGNCAYGSGFGYNPACEDPMNFCLLNTYDPYGRSSYCGVSCAQGELCPFGFYCHSVVILTQRPCEMDYHCACANGTSTITQIPCAIESPCIPEKEGQTICRFDNHAECSVSLGISSTTTNNRGACFVYADQKKGFCECFTDNDCEDSQSCISGVCCLGEIKTSTCSRREGATIGYCRCATDQDCPVDICNPSTNTCEITGRPCQVGLEQCPQIPCVNGGCYVGDNCAPTDGLTCGEVN